MTKQTNRRGFTLSLGTVLVVIIAAIVLRFVFKVILDLVFYLLVVGAIAFFIVYLVRLFRKRKR